MASRIGTTQSTKALSAAMIAALLGGAVGAAASGCFLTTTGQLTDATGGGSTTTTISSTGGSGGATTTSSSSTTTSSSSSTASSSGVMMCTTPAMCGADTACATWACNSGVCTPVPVAKGEACLGGSSGVCDAAGACVTCFDDGGTTYGCMGGMECTNGVCTSCNNNTKDNDESDVDCGGSCPGCVDGDVCVADADCAKNHCDASKTPHVCISCSDGVKNGTETDIDCGAACNPKCALGKVCLGNADCASGECKNGQCTACADGVKNGTETDVDCGGLCGLCGIGKACASNGECANGICADGVCCSMACTGACVSCALPNHFGTCTKVASGLDDNPTCGGGKVCDGAGVCQNLTAKKAVGAMCATGTECFNGTCSGGFCKIKNGDACAWSFECGSNLCSQGTCVACANTPECGALSACNNGTCLLQPGTLCGADTNDAACFENVCQSGFCTTLQNVGGPCIDQADCKGHLCKNGVCATCTVADCVSCAAGSCKAPSGQSCNSNAECESGQCVGSPFKRCN